VAGEYLDDSVERVPLVDHEGKSGALLERVTLPDGREEDQRTYSRPTKSPNGNSGQHPATLFTSEANRELRHALGTS
jgi:hypothetical protein